MKLLSPKLFETQELSHHSKWYTGEQPGRGTLKYIALYRKALRNSNALNSSRTDLKIEDKINEYDTNFIKTNYGLNLMKTEAKNDLVPTDSSLKNNSARDYIKINVAKNVEEKFEPLELPKIKNSSPSPNKCRFVAKFSFRMEYLIKHIKVQFLWIH